MGLEELIENESDLFKLFGALFQQVLLSTRDDDRVFVVLIDALDECNRDGQAELLRLLSKHFTALPSWLKASYAAVARASFSKTATVWVIPSRLCEWTNVVRKV